MSPASIAPNAPIRRILPQLTLTTRHRDPVTVAQRAPVASPSSLRPQRGGDERAVVVVGREQLEPQCPEAGADAAAEPHRARNRASRPSASIVRSARRAPAPGRWPGVNGVWPFACAPSARSQSSEKRGFVAVRARSRARSETDTNASPGGVISAFCEPVTTTSSPHASVSSGVAPSEEMASTTRQLERSPSAGRSPQVGLARSRSRSGRPTPARGRRGRSHLGDRVGVGPLPQAQRRTSTTAP